MVSPQAIEYLTHLCEDFRGQGEHFEFTTNDVCVLEGLLRSLKDNADKEETECSI